MVSNYGTFLACGRLFGPASRLDNRATGLSSYRAKRAGYHTTKKKFKSVKFDADIHSIAKIHRREDQEEPKK
jgi:hypothetical protein